MSKSRVTDMAQKQSPRGPPHLRTSSSDSDPLHNRARTDRSPKLVVGRSPRSVQSDPVKQKKLGTRITDLESQLGQAQEELKSLKDQLVSAEAAKKTAQEQLEKKSKKKEKVPEPVGFQEKHSTPIETQELNKDNSIVYETSDDVLQETDVFEVPDKKVTVEPKIELNLPGDQDEVEPEYQSFDELGLKNDEINLLKIKLVDKGKELEMFRQDNEGLKNQLNEKSAKLSSAQSEIDEMTMRLNKVEQELFKSKSSAFQINEKLEATEKAKEELENEMKTLRVQTEQWRKAADAAASVLAGGVEMNGRSIPERCGSMDKNYGNAFKPVGAYAGYVGSPGLIDGSDDVFGGKRKSSGIRMFGDHFLFVVKCHCSLNTLSIYSD